MKCPYCAKEMSCGYIYNGRNPVSWIPRESRMPILGFLKPNNCVNLYHTHSSAWSGYRAEAFYCDSCHVVISKTSLY